MKKNILTIIIVLLLIVAGVFSLRFLLYENGEDAWICENGQLIKHGKPSGEAPADGCGDQEEESLEGKEREDGEAGRESDKSNLIRVEIPKHDDIISSPLTVKGEARGNWFFEGSFPIKILDDKDNFLAIGIAQAKGEWMTENFVPFEAEIVFDNPGERKGFLVLEKDNPSDMPELDDELRIPIIFDSQEPFLVKVYFNNSKLDPEFSCNKVFPVEREIYYTKAVSRATIEELLKGPTEDEKANKFFTSINSGVKINSLSIENKIARIDFDEGIEYQVGGSCRVSAIRAEIIETLKQFESVDDVIISVNGRTEDILQP